MLYEYVFIYRYCTRRKHEWRVLLQILFCFIEIQNKDVTHFYATNPQSGNPVNWELEKWTMYAARRSVLGLRIGLKRKTSLPIFSQGFLLSPF